MPRKQINMGCKCEYRSDLHLFRVLKRIDEIVGEPSNAFMSEETLRSEIADIRSSILSSMTSVDGIVKRLFELVSHMVDEILENISNEDSKKYESAIRAGEVARNLLTLLENENSNEIGIAFSIYLPTLDKID